MKTRSLLATLFAVVLFIGLSGCASDSTSPNGSGGNVNGTMTATVAGSAWSATTILSAQKNGTSLGVTGDEVAGGRDKKIQFNLAGVSGPGTYTIGGFNPNSIVYINIPAGSMDQQAIIMGTEMAVGGSVTITELTGSKVKGTFSFNTSKTTVSGGAFDVNF